MTHCIACTHFFGGCSRRCSTSRIFCRCFFCGCARICQLIVLLALSQYACSNVLDTSHCQHWTIGFLYCCAGTLRSCPTVCIGHRTLSLLHRPLFLLPSKPSCLCLASVPHHEDVLPTRPPSIERVMKETLLTHLRAYTRIHTHITHTLPCPQDDLTNQQSWPPFLVLHLIDLPMSLILRCSRDIL